MNEPEHDPYVPPRSVVEVSPLSEEVWREKRRDRVWRGVGTACLGYGLLLSVFGDEGPDRMQELMVGAVWAGMVMAFLLGGRRWHVVIAVLMLLGVVVQVYLVRLMMDFAPRSGAPFGMGAWFRMWSSMLANVVTMVCGFVLFVRESRRVVR